LIWDFSPLIVFSGVQEGCVVSDVRFRIYLFFNFHGGDYSPCLRFAGHPSLRLRRKEGDLFSFTLFAAKPKRGSTSAAMSG
jgi:hypothetical protein